MSTDNYLETLGIDPATIVCYHYTEKPCGETPMDGIDLDVEKLLEGYHRYTSGLPRARAFTKCGKWFFEDRLTRLGSTMLCSFYKTQKGTLLSYSHFVHGDTSAWQIAKKEDLPPHLRAAIDPQPEDEI